MDWVVGGKKPQRSERPRVVLARVGGGEAETRQGHLGVGGLLGGTCRAALVEGGLWGAGALAQGLGARCRLRGVRGGLPTVRLLGETDTQSPLSLNIPRCGIKACLLTHSEDCLVLPGPSAGAWGMGRDWEAPMFRTT